jgi:type I restriction enzyme M protein
MACPNYDPAAVGTALRKFLRLKALGGCITVLIREADRKDSTVALKKSELYSSLWSSCDELRGGMDASQYKDYILVLLFIKYVSDKYAGQPYAPITIPSGASFKDMVALKGKSDIGDQINKKIVGPLASANKLSDMPDHNG